MTADHNLHLAAEKLRNRLADPYVEVMPPVVGKLLADWLGCLSALDPSESGGGRCGWCNGDHAAAVASAINGSQS